MASDGDARTQMWKDRWDAGQIGFHKSEVHQTLIKYVDKLFPGGNKGRVFVPLCGKTVDMKWLADNGIDVVGLDAVKVSLEQFFSEHNLQCGVEKCPDLGQDAEIVKSEDNKIRLYCADMFKFNQDIEGTFDAIWDRGSLVAIYRKDVPTYAEIIKKLLKPGASCLVEIFEYDVSMFDGDDNPQKPPPPHPMTEGELKQLYEPACTVQRLDKVERQLFGKSAHVSAFLITKK